MSSRFHALLPTTAGNIPGICVVRPSVQLSKQLLLLLRIETDSLLAFSSFSRGKKLKCGLGWESYRKHQVSSVFRRIIFRGQCGHKRHAFSNLHSAQMSGHVFLQLHACLIFKTAAISKVRYIFDSTSYIEQYTYIVQ